MSAAASSGSSLQSRLRRAERAKRLRAFGLVLPLLGFLLFTFLIPIGGMLWRSVEDRDVAAALPRTLAALVGWNGKELPGEPVYAALAEDLMEAYKARTAANAAKRLNYDINGMRSVVMNTARVVKQLPPPGEAKAALLRANPAWGELATWTAVERARGPISDFFLLAALDLKRDMAGAVVRAPEDSAIYVDVLGRTLWIGLGVTALCVILGFPVAYLLAALPAGQANLLMIFVLLPFWTSLLVRTCAWIVLLQDQGLVNDALRWIGIVDAPIRLIFNRTGVFVAMTHVLLPFMILPLYSVMKAISPAYMRAAASLGAPPVAAFLRIYLPQTLPGVGAGALLVFILAIGYYITPALVGGGADQMLSYFIAFLTTETVNWGLAAALGGVLLSVTVVLGAAYGKLVHGQQITGGLK